MFVCLLACVTFVFLAFDIVIDRLRRRLTIPLLATNYFSVYLDLEYLLRFFCFDFALTYLLTLCSVFQSTNHCSPKSRRNRPPNVFPISNFYTLTLFSLLLS